MNDHEGGEAKVLVFHNQWGMGRALEWGMGRALEWGKVSVFHNQLDLEWVVHSQ
jgi:hypothetical protein